MCTHTMMLEQESVQSVLPVCLWKAVGPFAAEMDLVTPWIPAINPVFNQRVTQCSIQSGALITQIVMYNFVIGYVQGDSFRDICVCACMCQH